MAVAETIKRRWQRQRRRRNVGRAYDMALEIARFIPTGARILDVGCGNGFIAHHLCAMIRSQVVGLDVAPVTSSHIDYLPFDGRRFPIRDGAFDVVLLCYVLHHAQEARLVLDEVSRVLTSPGTVVVYEDIPATTWDRIVCSIHSRSWERKTGSCTFHSQYSWRRMSERSGFDVKVERQLSRWRNIGHPVTHQFYVLRNTDSTELASAEAVDSRVTAEAWSNGLTFELE